jgi:hypothetical protein
MVARLLLLVAMMVCDDAEVRAAIKHAGTEINLRGEDNKPGGEVA